MGLFSSKPGFNSYKYNKRFGGYRNDVRRVLNQHNSTSVASQKTKLIDGGINAITSGGKGMYAGRATSKELGKLIDSFETSGRFHKSEMDGIRKVFSKELAKKDPSSGSWSLFGTPKGISKARLEKNTFGSRSVENQIYSALRGHDKTTQQKLAKQLFPILEATAEGGQGVEHGRITRQEADSALAFTESVSGYTTRDRSAIKNILYRALGEKSSTTSTLHPLSTGNVTHKKTAGLGVTPPPADGVEKNTPAKTPVMHAPHMVLGAFIPNAATAPSWKDRATENTTDVEQSSHTTSSTQKEEGAVDVEQREVVDTPTHVNDVEDIKTATKPISSRRSFKERLARRRAERSAFTQYEQSTTQLTRASHESLTDVHTPERASGTTTFKERLEQRKHEREQLNKPIESQKTTQDGPAQFHMPSLNTHTTEVQSKPTGQSSNESIKKKDDDAQGMHTPIMKIHSVPVSTDGDITSQGESEDEEQAPDETENVVVDLQTNLGAIAVELYSKDAPATVGRFLKRVKEGVYNGTTFHRVVENYVIQAGETSGAVSDEKTAPDEKSEHPHSNMRGTVSMVSADKNAGGGAFSINVVNNVVLDGRYVVFGTVIAGMDVVDVISQVPTDSNEAPKTPVVIESVSIS